MKQFTIKAKPHVNVNGIYVGSESFTKDMNVTVSDDIESLVIPATLVDVYAFHAPKTEVMATGASFSAQQNIHLYSGLIRGNLASSAGSITAEEEIQTWMGVLTAAESIISNKQGIAAGTILRAPRILAEYNITAGTYAGLGEELPETQMNYICANECKSRKGRVHAAGGLRQYSR